MMRVLSLVGFLLLHHPAVYSQDDSRMNNQAVALVNKGRYSEALPLLDQLVRTDSTNTAYRHNRAVSFFNLQMYLEALNDYLFLINELPDEPEYLFQAGNSHEHLGDLPKALEFYNQAIRHQKEIYLYFFKRGTVLLKLQKYKEAIFDFNDALSLNPVHANSFHNRALAQYQLDDKTRACEDWCEASLLGNAISSQHLDKNCKTFPPNCR